MSRLAITAEWKWQPVDVDAIGIICVGWFAPDQGPETSTHHRYCWACVIQLKLQHLRFLV